jgi:hypothetical protein
MVNPQLGNDNVYIVLHQDKSSLILIPINILLIIQIFHESLWSGDNWHLKHKLYERDFLA